LNSVSNSLSYDIVRFKIEVGGWREIHVQKCRKTNATCPLRHQWQRSAARRPYAWPRSHFAIPVICYSFYPPRSDALFSNYFEDLLRRWSSEDWLSYWTVMRSRMNINSEFNIYSVDQKIGHYLWLSISLKRLNRFAWFLVHFNIAMFWIHTLYWTNL